MKGLNAVLGWLLMLAVLAVPSFLFYNWWAKNKTQSAGETAVKTSGKDVFSTSDQRPAAAIPATRDAALSPSAPVTALSTIPAQGTAGRQAEPQDQDSADAGPGRQPKNTATPAATQAANSRSAVFSTQTAKISYSPKSERNPMLSREDYRRIKQAELQRAEKERTDRVVQRVKIKDSGIENKLKLQGIVGNAAIINGEMYTAGQSIYGGKIIRVGADYVICEYKGTRFKKVLK